MGLIVFEGTDGPGNMRSVEDIHEEIWGLLAPLVKEEG